MPRILLLRVVLLGLVGAVSGAALAQSDVARLCPPIAQFAVEPPAALSDSLMPESERLMYFHEVWKTIDDSHLFALVPKYGSGDWNAFRSEYMPKVRAARSDSEFYETVSEMVRRFDRADSVYWPAWLFDISGPTDGGYGGIGARQDRASVDREGEYLRIKVVYPDSPAEDAGLAPRDRILAVDGSPCPAASSIRGEEGTVVTLTVQSPGQPPRDVQLTRRRVIPPEPAPVISRLEDEPTLAYLRVPSFESVMAERFQAGFEQLLADGQPLSGLIVDLRDSTAAASMQVQDAILGHFVEGGIYKYFSRNDADFMVGMHETALYERLSMLPLAVLVDGNTTRTAETMAMALRTRGKGWLIGTATPGRTFGFQDFELADGSRLRIPTHGVKLLDQTMVEGVGLAPDVVVDEDWTEYREEEDPYLLAAIEYLRGQAAANVAESQSESDAGALEPSGEPSAQAANDAEQVTEPLDQPGIPLAFGDTAQQLGEGPGSSFVVTCPAGGITGRLWGTGIYTDDSSICLAAIHAGVLTPEGGAARVKIEEGQAAYEASTRNEVTSSTYGSWRRSFSVSPATEATEASPSTPVAASRSASCSSSLPGMASYLNREQGYCVVHDARWEVVEGGSGNVTIQIPFAAAPERMGLNIQAMELTEATPLDAAFGSFVDSMWWSFEGLSNVEVLERGDVVVSGLPAKLLTFAGDLSAQQEQFAIVGQVYGVQGSDRKLYVLTFVMDTTKVPLEGYTPTLELMLESFTLDR